MGDRYVEITRDEMEKFIKNSYRPYRPKEGRVGEMLTFTLRLGPSVGLRIHTSLSIGRTEARGVGDDAIEVFLISTKLSGRKEYLMSRSTLKKHGIVLVMRTKNWRNALDDRVDKLIDMYEENESYWENRAGGDAGKGDGPSPKQLEYIQNMVSTVKRRGLADKIHWKDFGLTSGTSDFSALTTGQNGTASRFIEHVKSVLEDAEVKAEHDRQVNDKSDDGGSSGPTNDQLRQIGGLLRGKAWLWEKAGLARKYGPIPDGPDDFREKFTTQETQAILDALKKESASAPSGGTSATFAKLQDGSWGIRGQNLVEGTWVTVTKRSGQSSKVQVGEIVWTGRDGVALARIGGQRRYATDEEPDIEPDIGEPEGFELYGGIPSGQPS